MNVNRDDLQKRLLDAELETRRHPFVGTIEAYCRDKGKLPKAQLDLSE